MPKILFVKSMNIFVKLDACHKKSPLIYLTDIGYHDYIRRDVCRKVSRPDLLLCLLLETRELFELISFSNSHFASHELCKNVCVRMIFLVLKKETYFCIMPRIFAVLDAGLKISFCLFCLIGNHLRRVLIFRLYEFLRHFYFRFQNCKEG